MTRAIVRLTLCGVLVWLTAAVTVAQTSTTTETKKFQVISVDGNDLVVKLPEGTKAMTVPEDFRFTVDGKQLSVHELKPGMAGTATITTKTTTTPVTVTEVKNGTVIHALGQSIIVRLPDGEVKQFTQSDIDKRGVKIMRDGKPAEITDFRDNDQLSATIITSKPPRVMTQREVQATLAKSGAGAGAGAGAERPLAPRRRRQQGRRRPVGGDLRLCAEDAAQDREPAADSRAGGHGLSSRRAGPHRRSSPRDAVPGVIRRRAAPHRWAWPGRIPARGASLESRCDP